MLPLHFGYLVFTSVLSEIKRFWKILENEAEAAEICDEVYILTFGSVCRKDRNVWLDDTNKNNFITTLNLSEEIKD